MPRIADSKPPFKQYKFIKRRSFLMKCFTKNYQNNVRNHHSNGTSLSIANLLMKYFTKNYQNNVRNHHSNGTTTSLSSVAYLLKYFTKMSETTIQTVRVVSANHAVLSFRFASSAIKRDIFNLMHMAHGATNESKYRYEKSRQETRISITVPN